MHSLRDTLQGAVVMAPMTKGSNLPYRQLCIELGARITMSEMTVARRLTQKRKGEFALIRKATDEPFFGVQLAGNNPEEMAWAAALVESRGANLIDVNLGCPIDFFTRKGLGAALGRQPSRVRRIVEAMKQAAFRTPVTVKIRLGWKEDSKNYLELAAAAVDGGADAIFVHGRTREQRYTKAADWDAIGQIVAAVPVPVIGNGDILYRHDVAAAFARSGCTAVMAARGVLIKPWLYRELEGGSEDPSAEERLALYRRYVHLARAHWGEDEIGIERIRPFLHWHFGFWCRYVPPRADGTYPGLQQREAITPRSPLEALLARTDAEAHAYLTDVLLKEEAIDLAAVPPPAIEPADPRGRRDAEDESAG